MSFKIVEQISIFVIILIIYSYFLFWIKKTTYILSGIFKCFICKHVIRSETIIKKMVSCLQGLLNFYEYTSKFLLSNL